MKFRPCSILVAALTTLLCGCAEDGGGPTGPGQEVSTMTARVGGVSWSADIVASAIQAPDSPVLGMTGQGTYGQSTCSVIITLAQPSVGVFQLGGSSNYSNFGRVYPPGDGTGYTTIDSRAQGTVRVTSLTEGRISGTFAFTAYKTQGESIEVANGEFDLRIIVVDKGAWSSGEDSGLRR